MVARGLRLVLRLVPLALAGCALEHAFLDPSRPHADGNAPDAVTVHDGIDTLDGPPPEMGPPGEDVVAEDIVRMDVVVPPDVPPPPDIPAPPPDIPTPPPDIPAPPPDVPPDMPPPPPRVPPGGNCAPAGSVCADGSECVHYTSNGGGSVCLLCGQLGQRVCLSGGLHCNAGTPDTRAGHSAGICADTSMGNRGRVGGTCMRDSDCPGGDQCDGVYDTPVCLQCGAVGQPCCCDFRGCGCDGSVRCETGVPDSWTVCH